MSARTDLQDEVEKYLNIRPASVTIHEEVSDFFSINRGDIVLLDGHHYVISGTARERSFGLDEEPKYWVKYAYDVSTGKRKIIKLVYLEQFDLKYGEHVVRCFRSPAKEGRALECVRGHVHFMQGRTIAAERNKEVRIIDHISGKTLLDKIETHPGPHEAYFRELLPSLLQLFVPCLTALDSLHRLGIRHGDVRADHLILARETGRLRWIDFDYDFIFDEAPLALDLLGVGNILSELLGKGERTIHNLRFNPALAQAMEDLSPEDFSPVEPTRLMNWKKLYPYVPDKLNRVLMHFAAGTERYYESAAEIAEDLADATASMPAEDHRPLTT